MKEKTTKKNYYSAIGRRKQSVAVVKILKGKGKVMVNGKDAKDYFQSNDSYIHTIKAPLELLSKANEYDIEARVEGGGLNGQADSVRLGVARALVELSDDFRSSLKKHGYLTRDPRKKERKKPGLKKARKSSQFSKR